jgi:toxin
MKHRFSFACVLAAVLSLVGLVGCKPTSPWAQGNQGFANQSARSSQTVPEVAAHDLSSDETLGGHTLKRHVGRTDAQLEARLRDERNISAASTYTDRATAEAVIASALDGNRDKITRWLERDRHPNLVLDYDGGHPVGRTMNRGEQTSQPCAHAIVVLHWDGENEYHVLTSYPECR